MNKQGGFIKLIVLIVVAILVLGYFNIRIRDIAEKPETKDNISYVTEISSKAWHSYLSKPVLYFWNNIFVGILWSAFINNFDLIKQGMSPVDFAPSSDGNKNIDNVLFLNFRKICDVNNS